MKALCCRIILTVCAAAGSLACTSCSTNEKEISRGGIVANTMTRTFVVASIQAEQREVVLRDENGELTTCVCGSDIRNFDQLRVGDRVEVTLAEELAIVLIKDELAPAAGQATVLVRSPAGAKPGGQVVNTAGFVAQVEAVDISKRLVTLQMPDGRNKTVKVGDSVSLANVQRGDTVGVRLTEALMITVSEPGKKPD